MYSCSGLLDCVYCMHFSEDLYEVYPTFLLQHVYVGIVVIVNCKFFGIVNLDIVWRWRGVCVFPLTWWVQIIFFTSSLEKKFACLHKWVSFIISIGGLGMFAFSADWCHLCITWIFYVPRREDFFTHLFLVIPSNFKNLQTGFKDDIFHS